MTANRSSPALATLAMRERAAAKISEYYAAWNDRNIDGSSVSLIGSSIRALPTTFTNAELLAAAMQVPEVRALLEAAKAINKRCLSGDFYSDYNGDIQILSTMSAAIAPFGK